MSPSLYIVTTALRGGAGDSSFDDCSPADYPTSVINKIVIKHGSLIDSLQVYYSWNDGEGITYGGTGGRSDELVFEDGEFVTKVEGRSTADNITRLTFVTNKRRWGPYGGTHGEYFVWGAADGAPPMRLLAFSGTTGWCLSGLGGIFAEYRDHTLKTVLYESLPVQEIPTHHSGSLGGGAPKLFSKFSSHLMSPIVTLYVGQERVEFHTYEDTLCQLPFFQAALQEGHYREPSGRTLEMPEDDPTKVSALIEFMYTGNYTYTYDAGSAQLLSGSNTPIGDLTEGLFHVGVYVVASKYNCQRLAEIAVKNFEAVLNELDDIKTLRLWKAAYSEGLKLLGRIKDFEQYRSGEGLVAWVRGLFDDHREEMDKTMSEHPTLACDLLRIATGLYC